MVTGGRPSRVGRPRARLALSLQNPRFQAPRASGAVLARWRAAGAAENPFGRASPLAERRRLEMGLRESSRPGRGEAGFTMTEMVVVMAVVAVVATFAVV